MKTLGRIGSPSERLLFGPHGADGALNGRANPVSHAAAEPVWASGRLGTSYHRNQLKPEPEKLGRL